MACAGRSAGVHGSPNNAPAVFIRSVYPQTIVSRGTFCAIKSDRDPLEKFSSPIAIGSEVLSNAIGRPARIVHTGADLCFFWSFYHFKPDRDPFEKISNSIAIGPGELQAPGFQKREEVGCRKLTICTTAG